MRQSFGANELRRALTKAPPLEAAAPGDRRLAAVFILFVQRDRTRGLSPNPLAPPSPHEEERGSWQGVNLLMIRRAELGDPWSGQIAFPGGHVQTDDADALAACFRELTEEVGIKPATVTCLGDLGFFPTQTREVVVRAFVGWWDGRDPPHADPAEVAAAFEVPVQHLLDHHRRQAFHRRGVDEISGELIYPLPGAAPTPAADPNAAIWGVTARIIHRLLQVLGDDAGTSAVD